ncbi:MAG TPA: hypothetical protein VKY92_24485 [Verrucomicrobiae bacterium]|jgi:hypothetical protein|nr:hypothetical protein [Verrucomicrobiae bacterium]
MPEPKFSDAWCFGKEFQAKSKICQVCLANQQCQKKFFKSLGATSPRTEPSVIRLVDKPVKTVTIPARGLQALGKRTDV